jgi:hypothetical protein
MLLSLRKIVRCGFSNWQIVCSNFYINMMKSWRSRLFVMKTCYSAVYFVKTQYLLLCGSDSCVLLILLLSITASKSHRDRILNELFVPFAVLFVCVSSWSLCWMELKHGVLLLKLWTLKRDILSKFDEAVGYINQLMLISSCGICFEFCLSLVLFIVEFYVSLKLYSRNWAQAMLPTHMQSQTKMNLPGVWTSRK